MWTITEIKSRGKAAFLRNFWLCVLVAAILAFASGGSGSNGNNSNHGGGNETGTYYQDAAEPSVLFDNAADVAGTLRVNVGPFRWVVDAMTAGFGMAIALLITVGSVAFGVLVLNPLEVGCRRFFLVNLDGKAPLGEIGYAFKNGWGNTAWVLFLRTIRLFLWTLLFIVPGIIKAYEYRMIPYLLADNPNMSAEDAFSESRRMMNGNKLQAFLLDLSFIGWHLLALVTLGLSELFWTAPYQASTDAALYDHLYGYSRRNYTGYYYDNNPYGGF